METFSTLLAPFEGNQPVTKASDSELWDFLCGWTNGRANSRVADDLRRHRAHFDVNVMTLLALFREVHSSHVVPPHKALIMQNNNFFIEPNKLLYKQSNCQCLETPWWLCGVIVMKGHIGESFSIAIIFDRFHRRLRDLLTQLNALSGGWPPFYHNFFLLIFMKWPIYIVHY